jgi:hypothetical protein
MWLKQENFALVFGKCRVWISAGTVSILRFPNAFLRSSWKIAKQNLKLGHYLSLRHPLHSSLHCRSNTWRYRNKLQEILVLHCPSPTYLLTVGVERYFSLYYAHTTLGRSPLDEGSVRRRDLYLTTQTLYKRQTSMPPVGFEPTIPAIVRPQTYAINYKKLREINAHIFCLIKRIFPWKMFPITIVSFTNGRYWDAKSAEVSC